MLQLRYGQYNSGNNMNYILLGWSHPRAFEIKGITRDQLDGKRKSGQFIEGYHFIKDPSGNYLYHFERFNEWAENKVASHEQ